MSDTPECLVVGRACPKCGQPVGLTTLAEENTILRSRLAAVEAERDTAKRDLTVEYERRRRAEITLATLRHKVERLRIPGHIVQSPTIDAVLALLTDTGSQT